MILKFGKFKGQDFSAAPVWYQNWLTKQDWFKPQTAVTVAEKRLSEAASKLSGWDGYSRKGEAAEWDMFEAEKAMEDLYYCDCGYTKDTEEKYCAGDHCSHGLYL
jgi:hypothetical protein